MAMESGQTEPRINADERGLNALASENDLKLYLNLWRKNRADKNQSGIKQKSLILIKDKSSATNLRLSAFICGLVKLNTRQPHSFYKIKCRLQHFEISNVFGAVFLNPAWGEHS